MINEQGTAFIDTINHAELAEIYVSSFTQTMSKNPRVIAFSKMVLNEHMQTHKELLSLAKKELIEIPDTLPPANLKKLSKIALAYGAPYDKRYMKMMLDGHTKAVELFSEAAHNENVDLKSFANKTLPILNMQLDSAKAIYNSLK